MPRRPAPATQADIKRAIMAVQKAGLRVAGVRPDGVVLVDNGQNLVPALPQSDDDEWRAEA